MKLNIHHLAGEYTVYIGNDLLDNKVLVRVAGRPVVIVTDENVAPLWLKRVEHVLPAARSLVLPPGEPAKTLETVGQIWTFLARHACGRDTVLLALGGGVIGDMTGFAAACWMRGIDFIQVPTTLLAQVDASIGGKTGVDFADGKNLIGAFHPPIAVLADTGMLETLPEREFLAGMAEIIKAALIADADFFAWLEANAIKLRKNDPDALAHAILRACEIKAAIVSADEHERGQRALLNLGHTFAHALESLTGYDRFLHGEAVAIGLVQSVILSEQLCGLDSALRPRLEALLAGFDLPVKLPADVDHELLLDVMRLDKKHTEGKWRLVLLNAMGDAIVQDFKDRESIRRGLASSRNGTPC